MKIKLLPGDARKQGIIAGIMVLILASFAIGYIVAVNFSPQFTKGYNMAFFDLRNMVLDAHKDKQFVFYTHGLKVTLEPETMVGVSGIGRIRQ